MADKLKEAKDLFAKVIADAKTSMATEDAAKVQEHVAEIQELIAALIDVFGDGVQISDMSKIGLIIEPLMKLAAAFSDYKGLDKRRFVIEVSWLVYRTVDTYPDGNRNNIDIPFVFGPLERRVERIMVAFAVGMAMDALYGRLKAEGAV